jgi:hypothetical protein
MRRPLRSYVIDRVTSLLDAIYSRRLRRYDQLRTLLAELGPRGGGDSIRSTGVSEADSVALYEAVRERQPRHVLELGAGRSSAVIALAMSGCGDFVAVEENSNWLADHRRVIPDELLARIELIQRDPIKREIDGMPCGCYRDIPLRPYEFVHVDGPAIPKIAGARCRGDVIELLPHLGLRCLIVFDGSEVSARFARPYLERSGFKTRRHPFTLSYEFMR